MYVMVDSVQQYLFVDYKNLAIIQSFILSLVG